MRAIVKVLFVTLFSCNFLFAAELISLNPRLTDMGSNPLDALSHYGNVTKGGALSDYPASVADGKNIRLTAAGLKKTWLFGSMIEASTSKYFSVAYGAKMHLVRFSQEQGKLIIYRTSPESEIQLGVAEHIINRYNCKSDGDDILIDLSKPDFTNLSATHGNTRLSASDSGGLLYDVQADEKHISWVEKISLIGTGMDASTIYVRFFFKQYEASETYTKRIYSEEDQKKFGFFLTHNKQIDPLDGKYYEALANLIDVNKEITYYLHPSIPEEYREACKEGILYWNDVYEAACGMRPLRVELGEEWMLPSDIRYRVIYWFDIEHGRGGAYGPSTTDPLTGEIIDGDVVLFGGGSVAGLKQQWAAGQEEKKEKSEKKRETADPTKKLILHFGQGLDLTFNCEGADPDIISSNSSSQRTSDFSSEHEFICHFFKGLLCHEIGHTIGLRHNFSASADLKNIADGQIATSIMDYIDFMGMKKPGVYDYAAIAYGHNGSPHLYEGKELLYYTDDQVGSVPSCTMHDEGDPIDFQMRNLKYLEKRMVEKGIEKGKLDIRRYKWSYCNYLEILRKYVGANQGEASQRAEAFFLSRVKGENELLNEQEEVGEERAKIINELISFQQIAFGSVLYSRKPEQLNSWNPDRYFPQLSLDQQEIIARALADFIKNDKRHYQARFETIYLLAKQRSSFTYGALKSAKRGLNWNGFKQFVNVFSKTPDQIKYERKQLKMNIERALHSFTD